MTSDGHDELFIRVLLGERPRSDLDELFRQQPTARAEWEELRRMWDDLEVVLERPASPRPPSSARRTWIAGLLAACVAGFLLGSWFSDRPEPAPTDRARFALLLYGPARAEVEAPADPARIQQVIDEQRAWSDQLELERRHILSEKLETRAGIDLVRVDGTVRERDEAAEPGLRLGGIYIIYAEDLSDAKRMGGECPLLNYGGTVRVRAIEQTRPGGVS